MKVRKFLMAGCVVAGVCGFVAGISDADGEEVDWLVEVEGAVSSRNEAMMAQDWQALYRLTEPGSPARVADEQLVEWLEGGHEVAEIETRVLAVREIDARGTKHSLRVWSVQENLQFGDGGRARLGEQLCAVWDVVVVNGGVVVQAVKECDAESM